MSDFTADEVQNARRPIASLVSKSEKAQEKLAPGTWQHTMLRDNLKALRIAAELVTRETIGAAHFKRDDLQATLSALDAMISKIDRVQTKFSLGTSHHTLQRNRLKALRIARALARLELENCNA